MRPSGAIIASRPHLQNARQRLKRVLKAAELLRKKREALVIEFYRHLRPVVDARMAVVQQSQQAYAALLPALAVHGESGLRAMAWPGRDPTVEIEPGQVAGIPVSRVMGTPILHRTLGARMTTPGLTGPTTIQATADFEELTRLLLDAAPREILFLRLTEALALASRQVNTLEKRVAPSLRSQIVTIRRALDEREREEHRRIRQLLKARTARRERNRVVGQPR